MPVTSLFQRGARFVMVDASSNDGPPCQCWRVTVNGVFAPSDQRTYMSVGVLRGRRLCPHMGQLIPLANNATRGCQTSTDSALPDERGSRTTCAVLVRRMSVHCAAVNCYSRRSIATGVYQPCSSVDRYQCLPSHWQLLTDGRLRAVVIRQRTHELPRVGLRSHTTQRQRELIDRVYGCGMRSPCGRLRSLNADSRSTCPTARGSAGPSCLMQTLRYSSTYASSHGIRTFRRECECNEHAVVSANDEHVVANGAAERARAARRPYVMKRTQTDAELHDRHDELPTDSIGRCTPVDELVSDCITARHRCGVMAAQFYPNVIRMCKVAYRGIRSQTRLVAWSVPCRMRGRLMPLAVVVCMLQT